MNEWFAKLQAEFILNFVEDNRWKYLVTGLVNTLKITLAAVLLGIVIGTLVAIIRSTWDQNADRMRPGAGKTLLHIGDIICKIYLTVIRGTPVVVQLMIMFYIIFATSRNGVGVAMLAFGVNSGAYVAELIRGGIMACLLYTSCGGLQLRLREIRQKRQVYSENGSAQVHWCGV